MGEQEAIRSSLRMHKNTNSIDQPEGTARHILNFLPSTKRDSSSRVTNVISTKQCEAIPTGFIHVGQIYVRDNSFILFTTNGTTSHIARMDKNYNYTVVVDDPLLNFQTDIQYAVFGTYRLWQGCEDVIYFVDDFNPNRQYNFSRPNNYKDQETGEWDLDKFRLQKVTPHPTIEYVDVINGSGNVIAGSYIVAPRYLDDNLNPTRFYQTSREVRIYEDQANNPMGSISTPTNKAIEVRMSNLNPDFPFYELAFIPINGGDGLDKTILLSPRISTTQNSYIFSGENGSYTATTIEEVRKQAADISRSKHIDQIDNMLLLSNTKGKKIDLCGMQKYASKIKTKYRVKEIEVLDYENNHHSNNPNYMEYASHMGDEVVSLGIVYTDDQGNEYGTFHIPGRAKDCIDGGNTSAGPDVEIIPKKCIVIRGRAVKKFPSEFNIEFPVSITYSLDGVEKTKVQVIQANNTTGDFYELYECTDKTISNVQIIFNGGIALYNFPELGILITAEEELESSGVSSMPESVAGWDSTVYPFWIPDMEPWISKEDYNDALNTLVGDSSVPIKNDPTPTEIVGLTNPSAINLEFYETLKQQSTFYLPARWEIYNTAIKDSSASLKGLMGYYECKNSTYLNPINSDCLENDDSFWGTDWCGNSLINTPLRHHRLPDRKLEPVRGISVATGERKSVMRSIGIEFENMEYPPGITGHFFVTGIKLAGDYTVIDKGLYGRIREQDNVDVDDIKCDDSGDITKYDAKGFGYYAADRGLPSGVQLDSNNCFYTSPATLSDSLRPEGYIKNIGSWVTSYPRENIKCVYGGAGKAWGGDDLQIVHRIVNISIYNPITTWINATYSTYRNQGVLKEESIDSDYFLWNTSWATRMSYYLGVSQEIGSQLSYVSIKQIKDVHCSLDNITYKRLHNKNKTLDSSQFVLGGDTFIKAPCFPSYVLSEIDKNSLSDTLAILAVSIAVLLTPVTAGGSLAVAAALIVAGVGLTALVVSNALQGQASGKTDPIVQDTEIKGSDGFFDDGFVLFGAELVYGGFMETRYDWSLLTRADDGVYDPIILNESYQDVDAAENVMNKFVQFTFFKLLDENRDGGDSKVLLRQPPAPVFYNFNPDFKIISEPYIVYPSLPSTYNCCSDCIEEFPNRTYTSQQSFQEDLIDLYRAFLPNDYSDIQSEFGSITNIFRVSNSLFIQCEEALFFQPQNIQERVTDEVVSFIGTGEYFSIPARMILDSNEGTIGSVDKLATLKTPHGVFIVDRIEAKIWLLQGKKPTELSRPDLGFNLWFKEYLPKVDGYLVAGYDSQFDQIYLTAKNSTDAKSWTISFSFNHQGWFSYYSFTPSRYITGKNLIYSTDITTGFKIHNVEEGSYQTFDEILYPATIEIVNKKDHGNTTINDFIVLQTEAEEFNADFNAFVNRRDITFTKAWLYNSRQHSGELVFDFRGKSLSTDVLEEAVQTITSITRTERNWYFNEFRDMVNNYDLPLHDFRDQDYRYTDKSINESVIDVNKNWHELERFRDKSLNVKLIFDTFDSIKLTFNYSVLNKEKLIRN